MMTPALLLLAIGLFRAAYKGYVMWLLAHDPIDHGPMQKLDFTLFCPMPIAYGIHLVLRAHGSQPPLWAGFALYLALAAAFMCLHAYFERIGKPSRQQQREEILQQQETTDATPETDSTPAPEPRERLFFWLGVFVLPVFWSWFTLGRAFTRSQRVIAFTWLALTLGWMIWEWQSLATHWTLLTIGYPIVIGWLTFSLLAWLCYRLGMRPPSLFEVLLLVFVFGPHLTHLMAPFYVAIGQPFTVSWLLPPFILALLHLMLEPVNRWARGSGSLREC